MGKLGKISALKNDFSSTGQRTLQSELASKNMTRIPGTGVFKYPYKELDGKYRTGLDPDASYIKRILDPTERELEKERVTKLREKLENILGDVDLGPRSSFWNYGLSTSAEDNLHVQPVKLLDGDNLFDLSNPMKEIAFAWLRVHPTIASSYQAWERGEYPAETQYYVVDDEIESQILFNKKQLINKAIIKFDSFSLEKRKKVARLLGLPVTDDTKDEIVYNLVDTTIKQTEIKTGSNKGANPITIFNQYADMKENLLHVKDLVKQAVTHSIYRIKPSGKVYEGEYEIAETEEELVKRLVDEDNQDDLIVLEGKIKSKKLASF